MAKRNATEKRLFKYALNYKKGILIGLVCLMIAVGLELAGPFIAKQVIDEHIVAVEGNWSELAENDDRYTIEYDGSYLKRTDRLQEEESPTATYTLLQVGLTYYIADGELPLTGERTVEDGMMTISTPAATESFAVTALSSNEVYAFFKPEIRPILWLLGLYVALLLIAGVFQFFKTYLLQKSANQIVRKMRDDLFSHTQRVPMPYFIDQPAGTIVARITNDTEAIRDLYERVLAIMVTSAVYIIGIFIALFILDVQLGLVMLFIVPLLLIWMKIYKGYASKYNHVVRSTVSKINGHINEAIQGMPIIQAFNYQKQTKKEFEELNERHAKYQKKLIRLSALTDYNLVTVLRNLTFVLFIWYYGSSSLSAAGLISVGLLYAAVDYITRLYEPVTDFVNQLPLLEQARVAGERVFELLDHEEEEMATAPIKRYNGHIRFDHVSFAYQEDNYVIKDMNFEIKAGETAAFVGHTGSGKSSVMNLLFRFYDPQKGRILIDGNPTNDWSRQQTRMHMGIVLQDPFLFSGTLLSNVTMGDESITREKAIKALKDVGADKFIEKLPEQYEQQVGEGGSNFSLGERQLISFARALAFDPAILILDEATANIDTETEAVIQHALEVIQKGRTTLVIAHRLSTIQKADSIFVLEQGVIRESGNHDTLIKERGIYYQMYEMQQGSMRSA